MDGDGGVPGAGALLGASEARFETTDFIDTNGVSYDVTPDGQRLLVVKRARPPERKKLRVMLNFFD
jgi:hypothetical protein